MGVEHADDNPLRKQIGAMQSRVDHLRSRLTHQSLLDREDAVADLQTSLEELQTANEELRAQSDELAGVRHQLELERQRYQDLFEHAPDGYVVTDAHGTIREINRAAARMFGRDPHYLAGKPLATYVGKGDVRAFRAAVNHVSGASGAGGPEAIVLRVRPRDGATAELDVAITYEPVRDRRGVVAIRWMLRDVTQQRRAERDVQELNENLEQRVAQRTSELASANRTKDRFLAALSHELRTPLTPALAAVGELAARPDLPADARAELAMIRRNIELETRLIDDLLDLTRLAHEKLVLDLTVVDLHDVLRAAAEICCKSAGPRVPELTLELAAAQRHVRGDAARLTQVFWNLLRNAVKFTPDGGAVTVRTYELPGGPGTIGVDVTDTGIGIDPDVLPRLFSAFEQGDAGVARHYGGLGLGLTISKALVEAHGGRLTAHSAGAGRGSRFTVTLPLAALAGARPDTETDTRAAPARPAGASPANQAARPLRILLVEDHHDTARVLARLLAAEGHAVHTAATVADALHVASREPLDLIVSDLGLPDGSGTDLLRRVRASRPIPGIALTGYGTPDDVTATRDAGFAAHLTKPIDLQKLRDAIARLSAGNGTPAGR